MPKVLQGLQFDTPSGSHVRPKVPIWNTPGAPNPQNIALYLKKTYIFTNAANLHFGTLLALVQRPPLWNPRVPKAAKGTQKGSHFGVIFRSFFNMFVTQAPDGPGRWPQGATASQNDPKMLQKVTLAASKTLKRSLPGRTGATKWPQPLQAERALKQRTHTH